MRRAKIVVDNTFAGILTENEDGYVFEYDGDYIRGKDPKAISLTLPVREEPYRSNHLFSFFDGLIPEGWLLDIVHKNWKLNPRDRMGLLIATCKDCIGNVSVIPL